MSRPVFRYMRQKQFEKAPKSTLMERLTQMNVIPDVLAPGLNPSVEVAVKLPEGQIEPGVFVKPEQVNHRHYTTNAIELTVNFFRVLNVLKLKSQTSIPILNYTL